jgi:nitrate reductase (cytochrome), electron transfer subunit
MLKKITLLLAMVFVMTNSALADPDKLATLRKGALNKEVKAPPIPRVYNDDKRQVRSYPEQPPTIPHQIRNYQIDLNTNRCMFCHSRKAIEESQAPAISITHYMDREGQFLATVSPRRYFCTQCHISQNKVKDLVPNSFVDIDAILQQKSKK